VLSKISGSCGGKYEDGCLLGVAPCSLIEIDRLFRGAIDLMMEAVSTATFQKTVIFKRSVTLRDDTLSNRLHYGKKSLDLFNDALSTVGL
jgi:hypothetical protein